VVPELTRSKLAPDDRRVAVEGDIGDPHLYATAPPIAVNHLRRYARCVRPQDQHNLKGEHPERSYQHHLHVNAHASHARGVQYAVPDLVGGGARLCNGVKQVGSSA
jgi:adenosine deaminase